MNKIGLIIKREYLVRVKKKSFIVMTFLGPILMVGLLMGAVMLGLSDSTDHKVLVVDKTPGGVFEKKFHNEEGVEYFYSRKNLSNKEFEESPYTLMLYLNEKTVESDAGELFYKETPGFLVQENIQGQVESILEDYKLQLNKISRADYEHIKTEFSLLSKDINKNQDDSYKRLVGVVGFAFAIIIYMFIFVYGVQVMRGVIEEKTSRIVEVLISSVKPFQLMMGKIIGIAMVGLTQFVLWIVLTATLWTVAGAVLKDKFAGKEVAKTAQVTAQAQKDMGPSKEIDSNMWEEINAVKDRINIPLMLGMFLFYFIGGFLVYSSLFAAVGAAVDNETDTQQFMLPITIPLIFGFIVAEMSLMNPGGTAVIWFSLVPLTSPVVMMVRVAQGFDAANMWQLITSMVLLIAFFIGCVWVASRIYRTGILMYGKKVTYKELWKWLFFKG
jgi:ABC-2 type transport system permease protein